MTANYEDILIGVTYFVITSIIIFNHPYIWYVGGKYYRCNPVIFLANRGLAQSVAMDMSNEYRHGEGES
jgi:hypothetical protein